jgi:AraC-like DNA-binding protein
MIAKRITNGSAFGLQLRVRLSTIQETVVRERLQSKIEQWDSFLIEFPSLLIKNNSGFENSQRILFTCTANEANAAEICFALFGPQIVINKRDAVDSRGTDATLLFIYSSNRTKAMNAALEQHVGVVEMPVIVAHGANVQKSAQHVIEFLQSKTQQTKIDNNDIVVPSTNLDIDESISVWSGPLPEVVLTEGKNRVTANTNILDYRAEYSCRFVLNNFSTDINRDKMAGLVHLSPGYFSNMFRMETGMSFSDYLIQVRIDGAKVMLRRFELSVEGVSKNCGFNSLAHFSRTFKERCGVSPLRYRKNPSLSS